MLGHESGHQPRVGKATGTEFGSLFRGLAQEGRFAYNSAPPGRAIVTFRQLTQNPAATGAFAHAVQVALFRDGLDLNECTTYNPLLIPFGVEAALLQQQLAASEAARATAQEFAAGVRIGGRGLPTCVVRLGDQGYVLSRGFLPYAPVRQGQGLEQLLAGQEA